MPDRKEQPIVSTEKTTIPRLVLIIGGARSGKSSFAEQLAASSGRPVAFIATATADDDEMRERIARHRASRPREWHTLEEPLDLSGATRRASELADVLLLDCVTLWLGNVLSQASKQHESAPIHPANAAALALIRLTNAAAQLPCGSGETQGELVLRTQAGCKESAPIHPANAASRLVLRTQAGCKEKVDFISLTEKIDTTTPAAN
jgi:adenosyl cobinamide kinase/adenosyl cobinamide phosphate guanylyltransferase